MLGLVENLWTGARTSIMRRILDDALLRLSVADDEVNARVAKSMAAAYSFWFDEMGPVEEMTDASKQRIRKKLLRQAKEKIKTDAGESYGLALLSLYIEALVYRGDDAAYITSTLRPILDDAIRASGGTDDILDVPHCPGSSVG